MAAGSAANLSLSASSVRDANATTSNSASGFLA